MRTFAHVLGLLAALVLTGAFVWSVHAGILLPIALVLLFGYVTALEHSTGKRTAHL